MKIKPVNMFIEILNVLSYQELPVNGIVQEMFKRTGSRNKMPIIKFVKNMQKDGLIEEKRTKKHKQKRIKYLSNDGKEVLHIMKSINECKTHLSALNKLEMELVDIYNKHSNNEPLIKKILHERGWKNRQIIKYRRIMEVTGHLILITWSNFLNCLRLRLLPLVINNNPPSNSLSEIINYLISDVVFYSIKIANPAILEDYDKVRVGQSIYSTTSQKSDMQFHIDSMCIDFPESFFPIAKKLIVAYLQLLKFPPDLLTSRADELKGVRNILTDDNSENIDTTNSYDFDCLLAAYDEYLQDSQ